MSTTMFHRKSYLIFSVDDFYDTEAAFQIFWFVVNSIITVVLTILIETMKAQSPNKRNVISINVFITTLNLDPHKILKINTAVIENFFIEVITTIFLTGILSLLLFFLMKRFKCAEPKSLQN